jgi:Fe-S-cluster containining protein
MLARERNTVPCGSCHLCCKLCTPLHPEHGDREEEYQTAVLLVPGKPPQRILDRLANGDCVYLGRNGCMIWDRAPWVCRDFDCRSAWRNSDRGGRRLAIKQGKMTKEIFARGRELVER